MVQLQILTGRQAGTQWSARRFPVRIGRSPKADFPVEENGVWDEHLRLSLNPAEGFALTVQPGAPARVNGQPVEHTLLRNGDSIEAGALRLRFWISPTRQGTFRVREWLTWLALAGVAAGQIWLIYRLSL